MNHRSKIWTGVMVAVLGAAVVMPSAAVEIVTQDDLANNVVRKEQLVRVADNAIILLDTSSSSNDPYLDTGIPVINVVKKELLARNAHFPDLGYRVGIFTYTDWQENLPVQAYDRDAVAAGLATMRDKGAGPTPLKFALEKLDGILQPLTGRTAVFLFWDGEYTGNNPAEVARELAKKYDVCFYVISSAEPEREIQLAKDVATLNACSRLIPLAQFVNRPEYTSGALFDVRVTEQVATSTESRVSVRVDDINFAFNETELSAKDRAELDELAAYMNGEPKAYAIVAGYTDDVGTRDYNERLSRDRAEMVARYLWDEHGIAESRLALFWYGPVNPKVANDTAENQAKNRRVEISVGLGE